MIPDAGNFDLSRWEEIIRKCELTKQEMDLNDTMDVGELDIRTHDEAEELLSKFTVEEIRVLWERGAFGESPKAVRDYLQTRIIHGDLEKGPAHP